jgi:hypothetical protein
LGDIIRVDVIRLDDIRSDDVRFTKNMIDEASAMVYPAIEGSRCAGGDTKWRSDASMHARLVDNMHCEIEPSCLRAY